MAAEQNGTQLGPASTDRRKRLPIWAAINSHWIRHGSSFSCAMHEAHLKIKIKRMRYVIVSDSQMIRLCRSANPHTDSLQLPKFNSLACARNPWKSIKTSTIIYLCIAKHQNSSHLCRKFCSNRANHPSSPWESKGHGMLKRSTVVGKIGKGQTVWQHETLNTILAPSFQLETDGWRI